MIRKAALRAIGCLFALAFCGGLFRLYQTAVDTENNRYLTFALQAGNIGELMSMFEASDSGLPRHDEEVCVSIAERIDLLPYVLPTKNAGTIALTLFNDAKVLKRYCHGRYEPRSVGRITEIETMKTQQTSLLLAIRQVRLDMEERFPATLNSFDALLFRGHPMLKLLIKKSDL